jgi:acetoin utilization protein AcuB
MTKDPFTIDPEAPLGTAVDVMRTRQLRHLPVVDEAGQLVGIVTDRDLRQAVLAPAVGEYLAASGQRGIRRLGEALEDIRVRDIMTWGVVTTHPDAPAVHAALIMSERRVGSLPVVEQGRLVGMITERDLLRALVREESVRHFQAEGFLW